ncbi:lysophospholipid acyltransferase family protein [Pelagicoccus sp. SDUM812003]|uniref:lysophospholipid acyltransferase family protein n=1 Tax=Pelagicoccus sp. SDUM812003 TaxID=3041267 RepID=UPI00280DB363|nr:lysophospholipid acyltransferase family protein [Pelagicoccus sp. SDUM812003]MDQ8203690.1 lysophospholipid acyltransferase family protein [Pelagicoccus sp. SDUM812003]
MSTTNPYSERVFWFSHTVARTVLDHLLIGEVEGLNNVPRHGACILAVNHASHFDPPLIGCLVMREITFFARKTLWINKAASWWLDSVGTIPVDRDGDSDIKAMRATLGTLKNGGLLSLFPEGTRSKDGALQSAKPGIGLIAAKSQATVIPCRIFNSHRVLSKGKVLPNFNLRVHMRYGKPLSPEDYDPGKEAGKQRFQVVADRIMAEIAKLDRPRAKAL